MMDRQEMTGRYVSLLKQDCRYTTKPGYTFKNYPLCDRSEFDRRYTANEFDDGCVQVMRYLSRYTFADSRIIAEAAMQFRRSGQLNNVIIDVDYLRALLKKLHYMGCVGKMVYVDSMHYKTKDGMVIPEAGDVTAFCLTDRGASVFKEKTGYAGFIEEYLICQSPLEIMRRLSTNRIVQLVSQNFHGEASMCASVKLPKQYRRPIYGRLENSAHYVLFEPVFFKRDALVQTEEELRDFIAERVDFLKNLASAESGNEVIRKKSLVLVVEGYEYVKEAYSAYKDAIELFDGVYITSETMVDYAVANKADMCAPFLKCGDAHADEKDSGKMTFSVVAETPDFMRKTE